LRDIKTLTEQLMWEKEVSIHVSKINLNKNPAWKVAATHKWKVIGAVSQVVTRWNRYELF
jgi:hypothetical protein